MMSSIENDEWQPVKNIDIEKEKAVAAARNTLKKDKRINLRLTQKDYHQIQIKALSELILNLAENYPEIRRECFDYLKRNKRSSNFGADP